LNDTSVKDGIWLAIYDFTGNETNANYYTNETLNYTYWYPNIQNLKSQLCARYEKNKYIAWGDDPCSKPYSVLCEFEEYTTSTTTTSSSTTTTTTTTTTSCKTDTFMNIPSCLESNPWSFCQLHRQRNNTNMKNGIEYQIISVSCSLIC
jgi:hypothetical protein